MGYLPGLAMRRIADLHPGQAKTDARDAAIIAEAARSMPHTLRSVELDDATLAELGVLSAGSMMTSPGKSPRLRTGSAVCSPRFIRLWNGRWALIWTIRPWLTCSPAIQHRRR